MDAVAYLALHHTKFTNLNTIYCYAFGSVYPARINLPKARITLLFENTPLGKLWDIKLASLIRKRPVEILYNKAQFHFLCNNRSLILMAEQASLYTFEQAAGIRTHIRTAKARGYATF